MPAGPLAALGAQTQWAGANIVHTGDIPVTPGSGDQRVLQFCAPQGAYHIRPLFLGLGDIADLPIT